MIAVTLEPVLLQPRSVLETNLSSQNERTYILLADTVRQMGVSVYEKAQDNYSGGGSRTKRVLGRNTYCSGKVRGSVSRGEGRGERNNRNNGLHV